MTKSELKELINEMVREEIEESSVSKLNEEECNDIIKETFAFCLISECMEEDVDYLYEGANSDSADFFKSAKLDYKKNIIQIKHYLKKGDKKKAIEYLRKAKNALNDAEKAIKDTQSNAGSVLSGVFCFGIDFMAKWTLAETIRLLAITGIVSPMAVSGTDIGLLFAMSTAQNLDIGTAKIPLIATTISLVKDIKQLYLNMKDESMDTIDKFNLYKNRLLVYINKMKKQLDRLEKEINKK